MSKLKQCIYTVILLITCFVASPFIYKQIWNNSEIKKQKTAAKESIAATQPSEATAPQQGATDVQPTSEGEIATTEQTTEPITSQNIFVNSGMEYFDDALFIGDSRTVGIKLYGTLKNADYFCDKGLMVSRIDESTVDDMTAWDKLRKKQYAKIYVMLGVNEIGNDIEGTTAKYRRFIDGIKEAQPNAIIYLQANLHVASYKEDSVINNDRINTLNGNLQEMADNSRVYYIDVNPIFDDENGALQADITSDGLHVLAMYYSDWCDWLCQNTVAVSAAPATTPSESSSQSENTTVATDTTTSNKKPQNEEFSNI
ncbi:GDSL-type esterase/lipase family protein [Ruminococcus sp.]|uniref:GDSL-type esterase/lipase family protein n=1 Tax=Ruminococcus sp. TaxID=41978 RepID=UPI001B79AFBE|nr:GDSL-type esterase/lipase family protein [Ruminococcus sp.]MBP5432546.1 hypothetical protein [Ruminococcus sp.]